MQNLIRRTTLGLIQGLFSSHDAFLVVMNFVRHFKIIIRKFSVIDF